MGSIRARHLFLIVCVTLLPGCVTTLSNKDFSGRWKTQKFTIGFRAGPRAFGDRAFSYYEVSKLSGGAGSYLVIESAESIGSFQCVTNGDPKNYIRIIEDPEGGSLLIEEDVPNEIGPCRNYILVSADENGFLRHKYLKLPERSIGTGPVNSEFPTVTRLRGSALTYRYSDRKEFTREIKDFPTDTKPTPPG